MLKSLLITTLFFGCTLLCQESWSHPTNTPHSHQPADILWESVPESGGSSAHNHNAARDFGGELDPFNLPYNAAACWDDLSYRVDADNSFDKGHCYINEPESTPLNIVTPPYYIVDTDPFPSGAIQRIQEVFEQFGDVVADFPNKTTGIGFLEVGSLNASSIRVRWTDLSNLDPNPRGGIWIPSGSSGIGELHFDSTLNWSYLRSPNGLAADEWHFFSVALHEIGHVVGLAHTMHGSALMTPTVGEPDNAPGSPRYFTVFDADTVKGIRDLYTIPKLSPPPKPKCDNVIQFGCTGGQLPKPTLFVSFDEPLGYTATNFTAQRQLFGGGWTTVGGLSNPGCVVDIPNFGWLTYRVIMSTITGSSECQVIYFNDATMCQENP